MQDDDTANPGMLGVLDGETLWNRKAGAAGKACADCHGDARSSMKGVAARYPAYDKPLGRPVNLEQRINLCRARHQDADPLPYEKHDLLALTAFVAEQSRGMPITPDRDARTPAVRGQGTRFLHAPAGTAQSRLHQLPRRQLGQTSRRLSPSPRPLPNGYPIYRLEWQSLGSLQRRLRNCINGMRAQNFEFGAPELVELELYLMSRARGMPVETPAVRP